MSDEALGSDSRFKRYLDEMTTLQSTLGEQSTATEEERFRARDSFAQIRSILRKQQQNDIERARTHTNLDDLAEAAVRGGEQLEREKRLYLKKKVDTMNLIKNNISTTDNSESRQWQEEVLRHLENIATAAESRFDLQIMSHWFNTFTRPSLERKPEKKITVAPAVQGVDVPDPTEQESAINVATIDQFDSEARQQLSATLTSAEQLIAEAVDAHRDGFMRDLGRVKTLVTSRDILYDVDALMSRDTDGNTVVRLAILADRARELQQRGTGGTDAAFEEQLTHTSKNFALASETLGSHLQTIVQHVNSDLQAVADAAKQINSMNWLLTHDAARQAHVRAVLDALLRDLLD